MDYLPEAVDQLRYIENQVLSCMRSWGYREIMTPTLEFYDTVGVASTTSDGKLFKLLDKKGTTIVLRSELTAPIARVVSSVLKEEPLPLRLAYHANVFRAIEEEAGRQAEFFQTGAELVGDGSAEADAEVIALAVSCLQAAGIDRFKIALGHVGYLNGLLQYALPESEDVVQDLKESLLKRNHVRYRELIDQLSISSELKHVLKQVVRYRGGQEIDEKMNDILTNNELSLEAVRHLRKVWDVLEDYGVSEFVRIDLSLIGDFSYYTGMTFEGYVEGLGFPICSGGRYDNLLKQFGRPAPATGFALKTNRLLEVIHREPAATRERVLIVYDESNRKQALTYAQQRRKEAMLNGKQMIETRLIRHRDDLEKLESEHGFITERIDFIGGSQ